MTSANTIKDVEIKATVSSDFMEILTPDALDFIKKLHHTFEDERIKLLDDRDCRQSNIDSGHLLDFLPETEHIRNSDWVIAKLPDDLKDRRVEITGPVDRKMIINALNSGAKSFMADFEDSNAPTWENNMNGHINLRDAINGTITYENPKNNKEYKLNDETATLILRPRGWHLNEKNIYIDGQPISGSLFDFGIYFFHNAKTLIKNGSGPYFYLPKIESHHEARLWNDVFIFAQDELDIPQGTIKATVLIETITAAFEMDEILYELREHSAGLNCGRWDYIFSYLKRFRNMLEVILPNREQITMTTPFMRAYSLLCVKTCHRRGAPAIGGMAAQIPSKDPEVNKEALKKVSADKQRDANDGFDGSWIAHPGLVSICQEQFDKVMSTPNQIYKQLDDVHVTSKDLLEIPVGTITEEGLRTNISVGIQYIASWLRGSGAVPINNLMEDAATAEISRGQVWQWIRHPQGRFSDGRNIDKLLFKQTLEDELNRLEKTFGKEAYNEGLFKEASDLFTELTENNEFSEFLTIAGYKYLN